MTSLSLIIPCFNCSQTLEQAVESIYRQDPVIPFDLTMVDDGSTDSTYEVMQALAGRRSNINLVRHSSNQGGGAARNSAVANSAGDLIFCLDRPQDAIFSLYCLQPFHCLRLPEQSLSNRWFH